MGVDLSFTEWTPSAKFYRSLIATSAPVGLDVSLDAEGNSLHPQEEVAKECTLPMICDNRQSAVQWTWVSLVRIWSTLAELYRANKTNMNTFQLFEP